MKNEELKPCPFCGHEAVLHQSDCIYSDYDVGCFNGECLVEPHAWAESKEEAVTKWNTRAPIKYPMEEDVDDIIRQLRANKQ